MARLRLALVALPLVLLLFGAPAEAQDPELTAEFPASPLTSVFHLGAADTPQVVVAFNRPVAAFEAGTPSVAVSGATVAGVSANPSGGAANAYLFTLTPAGAGAITFSLVADQACRSVGICTADGTLLTDVPEAIVIGSPVAASFAQADYDVREGGTASVTVRLSAAHQGVRGVVVPAVVSPASTASADDFSPPDGVSFAAGETEAVSTAREVAENTAAGVDIGAPVVATDSSGTVTYTLGGTDAASFDIDAATGQLETSAALDYETRSSYEVTVTATDSGGTTDIAVTINVTNVIELSAITGPTSASFGESGWGRVATFTASSDQDRDGVNWTLSGDDAGHFSIDSPAGALRFDIDPVSPNLFRQPPDFENPLDADRVNSYQVTVVASVGANSSAPISLTVTVIDEDENGQLTLSTTKPQVGQALTASLSDPDSVSGTVVWTWERSAGRNRWVTVDGATHSSYAPVAADSGEYLRITATYGDGHGTGKTVSEVAPNVVTGPLLTGLTAETDDSQAAPARGLYPAFDPLTLHYGIGCNSTDTLVLTVSAAADTRVAVAGVQAASAPMAVDVSEDSDVAIRVTDASGAGTTYVVHCLPEVFFEVETHTFPNTDAFEDLILFNLAGYLRLIDRNGVPRLHLGFAGANTFAVRFHRVGADGAYRYGFTAGGDYIILDEDFEVLADDVRTVTPLTSIDSHDFQILEDGNYLLMSYEPATRDFSDINLPYLDGANVSSVDVEDAAFQIVTPGRHAVFTWNSWGNMAIEDCVQHRFPVTLSTDPDMRSPDTDYAHINGMHVVDGVLVASIRGCSKVLGIDVEPGATRGDVLWRMGRTNLSDEEWSTRDIGPRPLDFINDPAGEFCGQHSARILPNGNVFLFDNGSVCVIDPWTFEQLGREGGDFSRAVEYALDLENHEAVFVRDHSLRGTRNHLGYANGTVFALDNGDWLVSWGRPLTGADRFADNEMATLVDPATGQEKLGLRFRELPSNARWRRINATVAPAEALALQPVPLTAEFPASAHTSIFHTGSGDAPQVIVAFNQPVVDFSAASPSISVQGGTVESVSAHVVAGERANTYVITLVPDGDRTITVRLLPNQACSLNGICIANGTMLSEVPDALVIEPPVITLASAAGGAVTVSGSAVSVEENHTGDLVNVTATDPDGIHTDYTLALGGTHSTSFTLNTGVLSFTNPPDHEAREVYRLTLTASNASESSTRDVTVTVRDVDEPADISFVATGGVTVNDNALTVDENHDGTLATFRARDPENDQTLTYTWSTDPPDHFVIRAGVLSFKNIPDYELPAGGTTSYDIAVSALDSDGETGSIAVTVTVTNVDEPPEITLASAAGSDVTVSGSAVSVDENHADDLVGVTATDPESTHTDYTLALGGTHSTSFTLNTGVLSFTNPPDHEAREVYRLTLTASNASESSTRDVTVTVRDVDEPADITFSEGSGVTVNDNALTVDENHDGTLATFRARDPENDQTLTYTWSTDPPDHFVIRAGVLSFRNIPDYENPAGGTNVYDITVSALGSDGETGSITVTVTVEPVDEPPEITLASAAGGAVTVDENAVSVDENHTGDLVRVTATDPETIHTDYTLALGGTHSSSFTLNAGVLSFTSPPNHEAREVYRLTLTASNASESSTLNVTVTVRDVNEPADISFVATGGVTVNDNALTVDENHDRTLATFRARDPENDQTLTYTWSTDPPDHFVIRAGVLSFKNIPDYEFPAGGTTSYDIAVSALDSGGMTGSIAVTVTVEPVDEPPGITLASAAGGDVTVRGSAVSVDENHAGDLVDVTVTDPDGIHTDYTLVLGGTHATSFTLNTGVLSFTNPPDHEAREVYRLTLTASNASESSTLNVTVTVGDVNERPNITGMDEVTVNEVIEPRPGQVIAVGTYQKSDPDRPSQTTNWGPVGSSEVLSGADSDAFAFDQQTGRLTFASPPDYENGGGEYHVTLTANDGADPGTLDVTVNVANVEEAGTLALGARRGVNGEALVATLTDPDTVATQTWKWQRSTSGTSGWTDIANADSNSYTPGADDVGNYLRASVTYTDGTGPDETTLPADTEFPTLNDASGNQPPTPPDPLPQVADVAENAPAGRNVVRVVFTDPEGESSLLYSLSGSDEFAIGSSSGLIVVRSGGLNYEEATSHSVTVRAEDSYGSAATVPITIGISDVNEAPTAADFVVTVPEDETVDIDVVEMASDEDAGDTVTVARVERHPEAGTVAVNVGTNDITYTPRANYHGSDNFTYQVKDGAGLSSNIATVAITIDPVNDAPVFSLTAPVPRTVSESATEDDSVGAPVIATDIDGDTPTYSLLGADASLFEIDSEGQITVGALAMLVAQQTYEVTVEADDRSNEPNNRASIDVTITVTTGPVVVVRPPSGGGGGGGRGFGGGGGGGGGGGPSDPSPSVVDFEWTVKRDIEALDGGHDTPAGLWSDGATLWVLENGEGADDAVYAYDLKSGERAGDREFTLADTNRAPRGIWSDRETVWVSDSGRERLFAHDLESGERLEERDIALAGRNRDARGIWSDTLTMWVLDGGKDSLFAYDLATGEQLAEYELASANGDPHGVWSDGVTFWVSDHGEKRLFAYRLPVPDAGEPAEGEDEADEVKALERVRDEEFDKLSRASNNSPRGIWSDGDVMYVADASDGKVYTYNMPDAIDARLASLTLSGVDFGEFSPLRYDYASDTIPDGNIATLTAMPAQPGASLHIEPADHDGDPANGHHVRLLPGLETTITVTSRDGSRERVYRLLLGQEEAGGPASECLRGSVAVGFSLVVHAGGGVDTLDACAESRNVTALYTLDGGEYVSYILGAPDFVNAGFLELFPDGLPPITPLIAGSNGPPSAGPFGDDLGDDGQQPWPECLRGDIPAGFSFVVYEGGSVEELETCGRSLGIAAFYALHEGDWVPFILGAPDFVNRPFFELFANSLPTVTPLVAKSDAPLAASGDSVDAAEN